MSLAANSGKCNTFTGPPRLAPISAPSTATPALHLLKALDRFLKTGAGNVKQLEGFDPPLSASAWPRRLIYRNHGPDAVQVVRVRNRKDADR